MSGGSYNHLYRDLENVAENFGTYGDAGSMLRRLDELGYDDVAADFRVLATRLRAFMGVFEAVEWFDSHDWEADQVAEAVTDYRRARDATPDPATESTPTS